MAAAHARSSGGRKQPSRLQQRAPASIQISPATDWKAAIPLLSPLSPSPTTRDLTAEIKYGSNNHTQVAEAEKPVAFKKWQHPAAPFCYEPAPLLPFVRAGAVDRKRK